MEPLKTNSLVVSLQQNIKPGQWTASITFVRKSSYVATSFLCFFVLSSYHLLWSPIRKTGKILIINKIINIITSQRTFFLRGLNFFPFQFSTAGMCNALTYILWSCCIPVYIYLDEGPWFTSAESGLPIW